MVQCDLVSEARVRCRAVTTGFSSGCACVAQPVLVDFTRFWISLCWWETEFDPDMGEPLPVRRVSAAVRVHRFRKGAGDADSVRSAGNCRGRRLLNADAARHCCSSLPNWTSVPVSFTFDGLPYPGRSPLMAGWSFPQRRTATVTPLCWHLISGFGIGKSFC